MEKLVLKMEQQGGKWTAPIVGVIGGMAKYIHLLTIGDVMAINKYIEPAATAALCAFAGMLGKQLYKWISLLVKVHINPWVKSLFNKKRQ
jgi:hypothetical protein